MTRATSAASPRTNSIPYFIHVVKKGRVVRTRDADRKAIVVERMYGELLIRTGISNSAQTIGPPLESNSASFAIYSSVFRIIYNVVAADETARCLVSHPGECHFRKSCNSQRTRFGTLGCVAVAT